MVKLVRMSTELVFNFVIVILLIDWLTDLSSIYSFIHSFIQLLFC